jgi:hypothetical protein
MWVPRWPPALAIRIPIDIMLLFLKRIKTVIVILSILALENYIISGPEIAYS